LDWGLTDWGLIDLGAKRPDTLSIWRSPCNLLSKSQKSLSLVFKVRELIRMLFLLSSLTIDYVNRWRKNVSVFCKVELGGLTHFVIARFQGIKLSV